MIAVFNSPSMLGEDRTVSLDEDKLSLRDITLPENMTIPGISDEGMVEIINADELEKSNSTVKYTMNLISNQCAILE